MDHRASRVEHGRFCFPSYYSIFLKNVDKLTGIFFPGILLLLLASSSSSMYDVYDAGEANYLIRSQTSAKETTMFTH